MFDTTVEGAYLTRHGLNYESRISRSWLFALYPASVVERRLFIWNI